MIPNLRSSTEEQSCAVLAEAAMLSSHIYYSLANKWPKLETDSNTSAFEIKTAAAE